MTEHAEDEKKAETICLSLLIEDKVFLKTFLRWVRTLGEIIQWMISAIQEVPWLIIEPKVSIIPSTWNKCVSGTFLTAESFSRWLDNSNEWIFLRFY